MITNYECLESVQYIRNIIGDIKIDAAIILGTGLGELSSLMKEPITIKYADIPHFPQKVLENHKREMHLGKLNGKTILIMEGRFHTYEGFSLEEVVYPIYVLHLLNVKKLIITNAAGSLDLNIKPGSAMIIKDYLNLFQLSTLRDIDAKEFGNTFVNMNEICDEDLRKAAEKSTNNTGLSLHEGVYAYMKGPQFETPAEIRALKILGAQVVGMSTVPEIISAKHCNMQILPISFISNWAAGISDNTVSLNEVIETVNLNKGVFMNFISHILKNI